jgi:hypothetical protein
MDDFFLQRLEICVYQGYIKGFEKCIIWPKKLEKDKQKLKRLNFGIPQRKLNTPMKTMHLFICEILAQNIL